MRCPNCGRWVMCERNVYKNKIMDKIIKNKGKIAGAVLTVSTGDPAFISVGNVVDNVMEDGSSNADEEVRRIDFNCPRCSYSWSEK